MHLNTEYNNFVVQEDLKLMTEEQLDWHQFDGKTILVTGATGMLAAYISYFLLYLKEERGINLKLLALCRTKAKAEFTFREFLDKPYFQLLLQDVYTLANFVEKWCLGRWTKSFF